jgi:carbamoyltransferase
LHNTENQRRNKPTLLPLVTAIDNSARVQLVEKNCESVLREVLELWNKETGCPVLLNTSLNRKGMPIVDNMDDYKNYIEWSRLNDIS